MKNETHRSIEFRGKRNDITDSNEWVYGGYMRIDDDYHIMQHYSVETEPGLFENSSRAVEVDPKSIGEAISTVNGIKVWEGDICQRHHHGHNEKIFLIDDIRSFAPILLGVGHVDTFEVIGNRTDNPELLKEIKDGI